MKVGDITTGTKQVLPKDGRNCAGMVTRMDELISDLILTSCQPHRLTSEKRVWIKIGDIITTGTKQVLDKNTRTHAGMVTRMDEGW